MSPRLILISLLGAACLGCTSVEWPAVNACTVRDFCLDTTFSAMENSGEHYQQEQSQLKRKK